MKLNQGLAIGLAFAALAVRPDAQTPQRPVFRANVEMVRIDAVVVDASGRAVYGLTKDDFELIDSGWTRPIANFVEVTHRPPTRGIPPTVARDVATNYVADRGRIVVVVLDDIHIRKDLTERTRQITRDFVLGVGDDAVMALISISGRYNVELTQDRSRILQVIDRFEGREPKVEIRANDGPVSVNVMPRNPYDESREDERTFRTSPSERRQLEMLRLRPIGGVDAGFGGFRMGGGTSVIPVPFDSVTTMKIFEDAARMLGVDDGRRKAFVWVSTGLSYGRDGIAGALDTMRRSGVVTYALDPLGTERFAPGGAYDGVKRVGVATPWDTVAGTKHGTLQEVAERSGGFAVVNDDNLAEGLAKIVADLDHYYVLGFYPEDATTKGYRPVQVRVRRPGLTIRHRQGYSVEPPRLPKTKDAVLGLAVGAMSKADIPMRVFATALPAATRAARVPVTFELSYSRSGLEEANGRFTDSIEYAVIAVDLKSGRVARVERDVAAMTLTPQPGLEGDTIAYGISTALALLPGTYQIRATGVSKKLGKGGSVYLTIDVPDFSKPALAISGLILGEGRTAVASSRALKALGTTGELPFQASLDREFARGGACRVYFELVRPDPTSSTAVNITLVDADDRPVRAIPLILSAADPGRVDRSLLLEGVAQGAYRVRVTALQASQPTVTREVGILVK